MIQGGIIKQATVHFHNANVFVIQLKYTGSLLMRPIKKQATVNFGHVKFLTGV